ncbi:MAG: squalene/phytoene synthase family protein, partial [Bacteroidota bacterium]|nr:squalene/phytoene synthase family protein [Bacteroidota bacterium]
MESPGDADSITRASRTNFALSFRILPKPKRIAIRTVYAFCRVTDDI